MPEPYSYSPQRPAQYYERDVVTEWPRGPRRSAGKSNESAGKKRSSGRRMMRAIARLLIAVLIGVGATLAWQSHGDEAIEMVTARVPSLAWLLPISTKSLRDGQAATAAVVTSAELMQQLKPMILDLATMQRGVDKLATAIKQLTDQQEKMAQDIAILQTTGQDIREKLSSPPQPRTVTPRKTPQSTGQSSSASPEPLTSGPPSRSLEGPAHSAR